MREPASVSLSRTLLPPVPGESGLAGFAYSGTWTPRSIYALTILTLIYTLNYVDRQVLSIVLPLVKSELHLTDVTLGLVSGAAFVLFYTLLGVPIARLADRSNRRNLLAIGLAFWSVMTMLGGAAANVWQLAASRFLMGAGEATAIAPSTSMTSDMFTGKRRQTALGILTSGTSLSALAFLPIVGWVSGHYGWRMAFVFAGMPGIPLALLLACTIAEPTHGTTGNLRPKQESLLATLRFLVGTRTYLLTVCGAAVLGISLYASQIWNPTFLVRMHHLDQSQLGAAIGVTKGLAGFIGAIAGGYLAGQLSGRNPAWVLLVPGIASVLTLPAQLVFLFSTSLTGALIGLAVASFLVGMHFGPVYSACQLVARSTMRTTSVALYLLFANLVGQIVGPVSVGFLNDRWASLYGPGAIRYSLTLGACCALVGGLLMIWGARTLSSDMCARANEDTTGGEIV